MRQIFAPMLTKRIAAILIAVGLVLTLALPSKIYAVEYGCNTYGAGDFNGNQTCAISGSSSGGSSGGNGGGLSNTGQALVIIIPASMIITGALALLYLHRSKKDPKEQTPTQDV